MNLAEGSWNRRIKSDPANRAVNAKKPMSECQRQIQLKEHA